MAKRICPNCKAVGPDILVWWTQGGADSIENLEEEDLVTCCVCGSFIAWSKISAWSKPGLEWFKRRFTRLEVLDLIGRHREYVGLIVLRRMFQFSDEKMNRFRAKAGSN